jgi:hypothetical protein
LSFKYYGIRRVEMMKTIGTTLFAVVLTMSPVAIVNAQTAVQPTTVPDVATKSDLQKATAGLSKELKRNSAEFKAELAQQAKAQADAQRAADKTAADKRDADQKTELARQAKAQADATKTRNTIIGIALVLFVVAFIVGLLVRRRQVVEQAIVTNIAPAKSPTPEDLYGTHPTPEAVRKSLCDNKLTEGLFTIDLPNDHLVFEYRARKMADGSIMAFFSNNERPVSLEHQKLRRVAKQLYDDGTGPLQPIELKPAGIRRVS